MTQIGPELKIPVPCDMLVDQDRYIGGDPVGHACSNPSVTTRKLFGRWFVVCQSCAVMDERRLSAFSVRGGTTPKEAIAESSRRCKFMVDEILRRMTHGAKA